MAIQQEPVSDWGRLLLRMRKLEGLPRWISDPEMTARISSRSDGAMLGRIALRRNFLAEKIPAQFTGMSQGKFCEKQHSLCRDPKPWVTKLQVDGRSEDRHEWAARLTGIYLTNPEDDECKEILKDTRS